MQAYNRWTGLGKQFTRKQVCPFAGCTCNDHKSAPLGQTVMYGKPGPGRPLRPGPLFTVETVDPAQPTSRPARSRLPAAGPADLLRRRLHRAIADSCRIVASVAAGCTQ
jgi:hypothetical protein